MKAVHRLLTLGAAVMVLYLAGTGSLIQLIDLYSLVTHAPDTDPAVQSRNDGGYGDRGFRVLTASDLGAAVLPPRLDIPQALVVVLKGLRQQAPAAQPLFVELRMAGSEPIGQVRVAQQLLAFDAHSGAPVPPLAQGALTAPPSMRQSARELHRFWSTRQATGVWIELICGIVLWVVILSGIGVYIRLLDERWESDQHGLFWRTTEPWRAWHRGVSVICLVFVMAVAFSGTWLAVEGVWRTFAVKADPAVTSLSDFDVQEMAKVTLLGLHAAEPAAAVKVLRLRVYGAMKQGVVISGGDDTRQLVFNAETGLPATLTEPGYPRDSGFPLGLQVHENMRRFHSGAMFGIPARGVDLLCGLALIFLSVSGIVLYRQRGKPV